MQWHLCSCGSAFIIVSSIYKEGAVVRNISQSVTETSKTGLCVVMGKRWLFKPPLARVREMERLSPSLREGEREGRERGRGGKGVKNVNLR